MENCEEKSQPDEEMKEEQEVKHGKHMELLTNSLNLSIKKFSSGAKLSMFKSSFKPVYKNNPEALKNIHQQVLKQIETNVKDEIDQMFKEENIALLLNQLDESIQKSESVEGGGQDTPAWRPTKQPELDILAHSIPVKKKEKNHLDHVVLELEKQNKLLKEALKARQKKLMDTKQKIDKHVETWEQVVAVGNELPTTEIKSLVQKYSEETV